MAKANSNAASVHLKVPKRPPVSAQTRQRQRNAHLSRKQRAFVEQYVHHTNGNASEACRRAGYKNGKAIGQQAYENLKKPEVVAAISLETAKVAREITPTRVRRRLDEISHAAEAARQFGPAVRAEELLGKSVGLFVDRSLQLSGVLNDTHIQALLEIAKRRQQEPIDLDDDQYDDQSRTPNSHTDRDTSG